MAQIEGDLETLLDNAHIHLSATISSEGDTDAQQENYLAAQDSIRGLSPYVNDGDKERRLFVIIVRMAMNRLSFIPKEEYRQKIPSQDQLHALIIATDSLRPPTLNKNHRRYLERILEASGINIRPEITNVADLDWHSVPH